MTSQGFLRHFIACNSCDLTKFAPFYIAEKRLGWVKKELATEMSSSPEHEGRIPSPQADKNFITNGASLSLASHLKDFQSRSAALAAATEWIGKKYKLPLRHEMYPLVEKWGDEPLAQIDRVAVPWFGIKAFGIHVNGFVRRPDGIHLWIGERAMDRQADPGKLDNLIGGGQPIGLTLEDNLCKEAKEEAGIDAQLALTARPVRTLSYTLERMLGIRDDVLFLYDLELPDGYTPRNTDGEVARFHLMPLSEVAALVRDTDRFKFNCNLVVTDFLIRHNFLSPENSEYDAIMAYLNAPAQ
ncbi:MAG: DUF4743 domain-containing protein [Bdellovibrionales bacterium]